MKHELAYISLKQKIILLSFIGPALLITARMNGANFWDGFAGGYYTNTNLQKDLIQWGLWIPILVTLIAIVLCVYNARKFDHTEKRFITKLVPLAIFLPLPLAFVCSAVIMFFFS